MYRFFVFDPNSNLYSLVIGEPQHLMWLMTDPIQTRRRYEIDLNRPLPYQITRNHVVMDSINQFKAIMDQLSKKYPQILDGYKLLSVCFLYFLLILFLSKFIGGIYASN